MNRKNDNQIRFPAACLFAVAVGLGVSTTALAAEPVVKETPAIELGAPFCDNMVLQRGMKVPVWGWSQPGAAVTVEFAGQKSTAKAGKDGKWMVTLSDLQASFEPAAMVITENTGKKVVLKNVLVGEVWLCSGQSNMAWKLSQLNGHYDKDIGRATYPLLRLCSVPRDMFATTPQKTVEASWQVCTPEQAKGFSAVAFFFGVKLLEELKVPIGLIESPRGGSFVEAWLSAPALRKDFPEFRKQLDTFPEITRKTGGVFDHRKKSKVHGITQRTPAALYNARIHPFIPYGIRGAIWYQGESNVSKPQQYERLFPAMIRQWRRDWRQGEFPFYYVQIAPCGYKGLSAAYLREAQMKTLSVANTGMAVTMDLGDARNIHPVEKKPTGERLALWALAKDYGQKQLEFSGPLYSKCSFEGDSIRLHFKHVGSGLASRDGKPLSHFTIAGKDGAFVAAKAVIEENTIVVSSPDVSKPLAVRFAFGSADIPNLMNKEGLPASSFRTDSNPISVNVKDLGLGTSMRP